MNKQEAYADKIAKLLRKAESTTAEEAEALIGKAQELMTKYAIDEAMLEAARGISSDDIEQREFPHYGIFRNEMGMIAQYVLHYNGCKLVLSKLPRMVDGKMRKQTWTLIATGFKSDLERAAVLNASLQVQAASAQTRWWKENSHLYINDREMYWARRQFIISFAYAIGNKLAEATKRGREQAIKDYAEQAGQNPGEASTSVELVLVSRSQQVERWYEDHYGDSLTSSRERSKKPGDRYAAQAGQEAGRNADVGQPGVGGGRRQIGR